MVFEGTPLLHAVGAIEDGQVGIVEDLLLCGVGRSVCFPVWRWNSQGLCASAGATEVLVVVSLLHGAPSLGMSEILQAPLAKVLYRPARSGCTSQHFSKANSGQVTCPSHASHVLDPRLLHGMPLAKARALLASLAMAAAKVPTLQDRAILIATQCEYGIVYVGQRVSSCFTSWVVKRVHLPNARKVGLPSLAEGCGMGGKGTELAVTVRATYDLWQAQASNLLDATIDLGTGTPMAHLVAEWRPGFQSGKGLGHTAPAVCRSWLLVGGACPVSANSVALQADLAAVHNLLAVLDHSGEQEPSEHYESERATSWKARLEKLLKASEDHLDYGETLDQSSPSVNGMAQPITADGSSGLGNSRVSDLASSVMQQLPRSSEATRRDEDFMDRLWPVLARLQAAQDVTAALQMTCEAIGEGHLFPVIGSDNDTAVGRLLRQGAELTQTARYSLRGTQSGAADDHARRLRQWRSDCGGLLSDPGRATAAAAELGLHKVSKDLAFWFEAEVGVSPSELQGFMPAAVPMGHEESAQLQVRHRCLKRLSAVVDLVSMAQTLGAPWQGLRSLAKDALGAWASDECTMRQAQQVFQVAMPETLPPQIRSRLTQPLRWELRLTSCEPTGPGARVGKSFLMADPQCVQCRGLAEPLELSNELLRSAQAALRGTSKEVLAEVLHCVLGVTKFSELTGRLHGGASANTSTKAMCDTGTSVFVCTERSSRMA